MNEGEPGQLGVWRSHRAATTQILGDCGMGNPNSQLQLEPASDAFVPHLGLSAAISRINSWSLWGRRGRPADFDFQRQKRRSPWRYQRWSVSAWRFTSPPQPDLPLLEQSQLHSQEEVLGLERRPRACAEDNQPEQVDANQRRGPQAMHNGMEANVPRTGLPRIARYNALPVCFPGSDGIIADRT